MRHRSTLRALVLAALLLAPTGCSFVLVHGPPSGHQQMSAFSCTRGNAVPLVDAAVAGLGLFIGGALVAGGSSSEWTAPYAVVGGGFVFEGLLFGASSVSGFIKTARCRSALREHAARESGAGLAPAPGAAPPRR